MDGNVLRVFSRLTNDATPIEQPTFKKLVNTELAAIYPDRAGDFTQALMELGATVCGPNRAPDCENCPCCSICTAYKAGTAGDLPVRAGKKEKRLEELTVFILCCDGAYALQKRPNKGLLAGLWQFPNVSGKLKTEAAIAWVEQNRLKPREITQIVERKHIFTHVQWDMCGVYMEVGTQIGEYTWLTPEQIDSQAALPTAFRQFWEVAKHV